MSNKENGFDSRSNKIQLFSFDIDGTLIDQDSPDPSFSTYYDRFLKRKNFKLVYNTGRLIDDVLDLMEQNLLPMPEFIIGGVGTQIYDCRRCSKIDEFDSHLAKYWEISEIEEVISQFPVRIERQPSQYQHPFKRSYFMPNATEKEILEIKKRFEGVSSRVIIVYSVDLYLDILPLNANKGNALVWLMAFLGIDPFNCLVGGDSGNDIAMFDIPGVRGIVVGNADADLNRFQREKRIYFSKSKQYKGILEGLAHFKVLDGSVLERML